MPLPSAVATERALIDAFLKVFPGPRIPVGPGDDAAVLPPTRQPLCVTTDALVEGVHFTLHHFSPRDIGHKALAVNLSDLAAMGATPRWFVCAITLQRGVSVRFVREIARGMANLAKRHRIALVGGNFSRGKEIALTLTCAGTTPRDAALLRSGGRAGDLLYVSGSVGEARLGLLELRAGRRSGEAVRRQRRPEPRIALGLLARRFATAGMDVSDGLARDLAELCRRSGTGARVELDRLPVGRDLLRRAPSPLAWSRFALEGGEDYELLLAVPPSRAPAFEKRCARAGERVTRIGTLTRSPSVRFLWDEVAIRPPPGFDHFA